MLNKNEIVELLMSRLDSVYCDTCGADESRCEECNRKAIGWGLSLDYAETLAEAILEE